MDVEGRASQGGSLGRSQVMSPLEFEPRLFLAIARVADRSPKPQLRNWRAGPVKTSHLVTAVVVNDTGVSQYRSKRACLRALEGGRE